MLRTGSGRSASATPTRRSTSAISTPVTYGHNSAAGAIGVAAYPFYAPFVPEAFTSPGPSTIYFDKNSKRLRHVGNPAEAGSRGDGRRQHDVLRVGLGSR